MTQQDSKGSQAQIMAALTLAKGQRVTDHDTPRRARPHRFQNKALRQVSPLRPGPPVNGS